MGDVVYESTAALIMSVCSLFLYSSLLFASLYQIRVHKISQKSGKGGSFIEYKLVFFYVMALSAFLSLPLWVGCMAWGCPSNCQWHGAIYYVLWSGHLLALIGYSICVGIPTIMWSDIINDTHRFYAGASVSFLASFRRIFTIKIKNGDFFQESDYAYSISPCRGLQVDYVRLTFAVFVCCYSINELIVIGSFVQYFLQNRHISDFVDHSTLYRVSTYIEPLIIFIFAGNCLVSGFSLQLHVRRTRLEESVQRKLLTTLNSVLLVVTITYITRAVCVLDLFLEFTDWLTFSYVIWTICTHWMPHLLGSSCLFYIMSQGSEKREPRRKVYKGDAGTRRSRGKGRAQGRKHSRNDSGSPTREKKIKNQSIGNLIRNGNLHAAAVRQSSRTSKDQANNCRFSSVSNSSLDEQGDTSTPNSPLLRYYDDEDEEFDDDSQSSAGRFEDPDVYSDEDDEFDDDYDSNYDRHYESQSDDGGGFAQLSETDSLTDQYFGQSQSHHLFGSHSTLTSHSSCHSQK